MIMMNADDIEDDCDYSEYQRVHHLPYLQTTLRHNDFRFECSFSCFFLLFKLYISKLKTLKKLKKLTGTQMFTNMIMHSKTS